MAGARLQHRRVEGAGEQHRRLEVDPQRPLDLLGSEVVQLAGAGQTGVGDEDLGARGLGGEALGGLGLG